MSSKTNIATGLIVTAIGVLIALAEFKHALFVTGLLVAVGGISQIIETIEKHENEN